MVVKFNSLDRYEAPDMTLCNPGSTFDDGLLTRVVGKLTGITDAESVFNFNATSELNFRINKIQREDEEETAYLLNMYKSVQNRRLIFLDGIGYYMITNITEGKHDDIAYKDVTASSIDIEIARFKVPYISDGTYRFLSSVGNDGLLEKIVETLPLWTIGHVDQTVASKFRTFEDVDVTLNCLGFMMENMQDAYECIFIFDCVNRVINVYDQNNYVRQTSINISNHDLINQLDIEENSDDLYTAISVLGEEDMTINAINPLGSNIIYNFNYYISWMTPDLGTKVTAWQDAIEDARSEYYDLNAEYYELLTQKHDYELELERIMTQMTMYQRCSDNIVATKDTVKVAEYNSIIKANGGIEISIKSDIEATIREIKQLISNCQTEYNSVSEDLDEITSETDNLWNDILAIRESLAMTKYFTDEEIEELSNYIVEGEYKDEYVKVTDIMTEEEKFSQMKILYDRAKSRLDRVSVPTQQFSIDVENFIFLSEFAKWSDEIETGCLISVEIEPDDIAALFLSNVTVNYEDHTLSMTFGNRFNKYDTKSLFDNVLGNISKTANTLGFVKEILYPIKNGEFDYMREAIQTSRDLTMGAALSSTNEEVIIDGSGYTGRRLIDPNVKEYDPHQIKITGENIVFTNDNWEHSALAIGNLILGDGQTAYGINAEVLIGQAIVGETLQLKDSNNNDIFTVMDDKISTAVGDLDIEGIKTQINQTSEEVNILINKGNPDEVITTNGYSFTADGLRIYESDSDIENIIDNKGMYVNRVEGETSTNMLTVDVDGVNAINLISRQFLVVGENCRFEDYSTAEDAHRTACFYIGS